MKKTFFLAAAIAFLGGTALDANAQHAAQSQQQTQSQMGAQGQEGNREKISKEQLPEAVQNALQSETYEAWEVEEVYRIIPKAEAGTAQVESAQARNAGSAATGTTYEIHFTNAEEQQAIARFNEDGTAIKSEN